MERGSFSTGGSVNDLLNKAEAIAAEGNDLYFTDEFGQDWVLRKLDPLIKKREPFTKERAIALIELIMKGD